MITYTEIQSDRRKFLSLTGLTLPEFRRLLTAFARSYERRYPTDLTLAGQPRQRSAGGGRKGALHRPEQKLLFILVYLEDLPPQVVMSEARLARRKKKPRGRDLTAAEKRRNRKLARIRVGVEHALAGVKRSRIAKDVFRNTKEGVSDSAMETACGLHNLRVQNRKRRVKS